MNLNTLGPPAAGGGDNESEGNLLGDLRGSGEGASGVPDLSNAAAPKKRLSVQNLIIVLAVVASAGSLFMMRQQGKKAGVRFEPIKVADPEEFVKPYPNQSRILSDLALSTQTAKSPEKLDKNPFKFDAPATAPTPANPNQPVVDHEAERIRSVLASLQIGAIMQGPTPVARINGRIVRVGDMVEDVLMVAQINDRSVDFMVNGKTHTVHMGDGASGGGAPRRMPGPSNRPPMPYGPPPER